MCSRSSLITIMLIVGLGTFPGTQALAQEAPSVMEGSNSGDTYHGSDIDFVDTGTGRLNLHIPIVTDHSQRGNLNYTHSVSYTSTGAWQYVIHSAGHLYDVEPPGYGVGSPGLIMDGTWSGNGNSYCVDDGEGYDNCAEWLTDSSGGDHPLAFQGLANGYSETIDGSGVYVGANGVIDRQGRQYNGNSNPEIIEDPNGNELTIGAGYMTDTLGRTWTFGDGSTDVTGCPTGGPVTPTWSYNWVIPGPLAINSGTRTFKFCYSTYTIDTSFSGSGVPSGWTLVQYDSTNLLLTGIVLPNGTTWRFDYDSTYGDLTAVYLPTGNYITYTWSTTNSSNCEPGSSVAFPGMRIVASRTMHDVDTSNSYTWDYNYTYSSSTATDVTDPLNNDTVYTYGTFCWQPVTKIQSYQGSASSGTLLKTETKTFSSSPIPDPYITDVHLYAPAPEILTADSITLGTSGPTSEVTYTYDSGLPFTDWNPDYYGNTYTSSFGLITSESHYDYGSSPHGSLLSQTNADYKALHSSSYARANILELPISKVTLNSSSYKCAETDYAYDASSQIVSSGVTEQHTSALTSGVLGDLTSVTQQLFINPCTSASPTETALTTTNYVYDTGMLQKTVDPRGNTAATYSYSSSYYGAYPTTVTNALSQSTTYTYDFSSSSDAGSGLMTSMTDPNSQETTYSWDDEMLRLTGVSYPDGGSDSYTYTDSSTDPSFLFTKKITSSMNFSQTVTMSGLGKLKQTATNYGSCTAYAATTYDALSRPASVSNPNCGSVSTVVTRTMYDPLSRVCLVLPQDNTSSLPSSCPTSAVADGVTTIHALNSNTSTVYDEAENAREYQVDGLGRTTAVWEAPSGVDYETVYGYDPLNDLTSVSEDSSRSRTFSFDSLSRLMSAAYPEAGTTSYTYDGDGNVATRTDARSKVTTYSYDALNRLAKTSYSDSTPTAYYDYDGNSQTGCSVSFSYGSYATGYRTAMCDAAGNEAWSYDKMGRPLSDQRTTNSITNTTSYTYNLDGSVASLTYPSSRTITYAPNSGLPPVSAKDTANSINYATSAAYTASGAQASLTNGSSLVSTLYYNSRLQPCRISVNSSGTAPSSCTDSSNYGNVQDLAYTFDLSGVNTPCSTSYSSPTNNGNVAAITNNITGGRSQDFCYDSLNRISKAQTTSTYSTGPSYCWGESYTIDAWANLTAITQMTGSYSGCNQESGLSISVNSNNQISTSGFGYDSAGNMTNGPLSGDTYTYNAENQMTQAAVSSTVGYVYDGDGKRAEKTSSGTATKLYWYDTSGNVLDETDGTGSTSNSSFYEYVFFNGNRIARRDSSSNVLYYFADHLGTSRDIVQSGSTSACYDADFYPFGGERAYTNTCSQNYKFTGKERDSESNLDNSQARYYSWQEGRFMRPDPLGILAGGTSDPQSLNLYSYVENNPVNAVDLDGLDCVYLNDQDPDQSYYVTGDCLSPTDNGIFVNGSITSFTFDSFSGDISYSAVNYPDDPASLMGGTFASTTNQPTDEDYFNAAILGTQMAAPGVNLAAQGLALFGNIVAPGAMTLAECLAGGGCSKGDVAMAILPEVAALREGGTILREGRAVGKGAEIIEKGGGVVRATQEYDSLTGVEKVYGDTKVKTLSDGSRAVLYTSSSGGGVSLQIQDESGRTVTKYRY